MKYGLLFSLLFLLTLGVFARDLSSETSQRVKQMGYEINVFNNGTFMPGKGTLGIWSPFLHPGIAVGKHFQLKYGKKYRLYQTAKLVFIIKMRNMVFKSTPNWLIGIIFYPIGMQSQD